MQCKQIKRFAWQQLGRKYSKEVQSLILNHKQCSGSKRFSSSNTGPSSSGVAGYWRSLKWVPIPFSVGFAYICYQQYGHIKKRENRHIRGSQSIEDSLAKEWQVSITK
nr:uncharacterized protein LOC129276104 [Lytechinus pictus]